MDNCHIFLMDQCWNALAKGVGLGIQLLSLEAILFNLSALGLQLSPVYQKKQSRATVNIVAVRWDPYLQFVPVLLQVIFVGYFGGQSHTPRIIGSSALAMGLGCLIMSLAYFTSPTYTPQTGEFSLICHPGGSESKIIHQISTEAIFHY